MNRREFFRITGGLGVAGFVRFNPALADDDPWLPYLSPAGQFYDSKHSDDPPAAIAREDWQLRIDGAVAQPLTIGWADLQALAAQEVTTLAALNCVSDLPGQPPFISQGLWTGVPLKGLVQRAQPHAGALRVVASGRDRAFCSNLRLDALLHDDPAPVLLVYGQNGQPLSLDRGQPVRLLAPGRYGFKSIKWLDRLELSTSAKPVGDYETQTNPRIGDEARMMIKAKIWQPAKRARVEPGDYWVMGYAVGGPSPVAKVEIGVDDGDWQPAELESWEQAQAGLPATPAQAAAKLGFPFPFTWLAWRFRWNATKGQHTLRCRAWDQAGHVMPDGDNDYSDGTNGVDRVVVRVK